MAGDASWAFELPAANVAPGQALEMAIGRKQQYDMQQEDINRRERAAALKAQQENESLNLAELNKRTGEFNSQTVSSKFDNRIKDEIGKIYTEYSQYAKNGVRPADYSSSLRSRLLELNKVYDAGQKLTKTLSETTSDLVKTNSNIDERFLYNIGANQVANRLFEGKNLKNPDLINTDNNLFNELADEDLLGLSAKSTQPFFEFFSKHPQTDISDKDTLGRDRTTNKETWKGKQIGDYMEPVYDKNGDVVKMGMKSEKIPGIKSADGTPMIVMESRLYERMSSDPATKSAMAKMWVENKTDEKVKWLIANGRKDSNITKQEEDLIKRNYFLREADKVIPSAIQKEKSDIYRPPSVNIFNMGNDPQVRNVYSEFKDTAEKAYAESQTTHTDENGKVTTKINYVPMNQYSDIAQKTVLDYANSISSGTDRYNPTKRVPLTNENTLVKLDENGEPSLYKINKFGTKYDYSKGTGIEKIMTLDIFGVNSKVNPTDKQRQKLIRENQNQGTPAGNQQSKKKKYNPATGKFE